MTLGVGFELAPMVNQADADLLGPVGEPATQAG